MSLALDALAPFESRLAALHCRCTGPLIDAHAHLLDACFAPPALDDVIRAARDRHVHRAIVVPMSVAESRVALDRCELDAEFMRPAAGVHPVTYSLMTPARREQEQRDIAAWIDAQHARLVCIGECGCDFSPWILAQAHHIGRAESAPTTDSLAAAEAATQPSTSSAAPAAAAPVPSDWRTNFDAAADAAQRAAQIAFFRFQVQLAVRYSLPLNIHSRSASTHVIDALREEGVGVGLAHLGVTVLLHAFDGSAKTLTEAIKRGYFFSATTSLGRDPQMKKVMLTILRASTRTTRQLADTTPSAPAAAELSSSSAPCDSSLAALQLAPTSCIDIPSALLHIVIETDSPALHPLKQPPPSAAAAAAAVCCVAENNQPSHLYIALIELFDVYCEAEIARAADEATKANKQQQRAGKPAMHQQRDTTKRAAHDKAAAASTSDATPLAAELASHSIGAATPAASSAHPGPHLTSDAAASPAAALAPLLTLSQLATIVHENSLRLFPRAQ